jgi:hypothetical protein
MERGVESIGLIFIRPALNIEHGGIHLKPLPQRTLLCPPELRLQTPFEIFNRGLYTFPLLYDGLVIALQHSIFLIYQEQ